MNYVDNNIIILNYSHLIGFVLEFTILNAEPRTMAYKPPVKLKSQSLFINVRVEVPEQMNYP